MILNKMKEGEKIINEPWPNDATLYQPYEDTQILLPEHASCLAVQTYLKMCNLPFEVRQCANAEFMSPSGRMTKLPFLRCGTFILAEFESIVSFVEQKTFGLSTFLDDDEKDDLRPYLSLVENVFTMAEMYISFVDEKVYEKVTAPRNGCVYPWPLDCIQNWSKRRRAMRLLKVYGWHDLTIDEVIDNVAQCCKALQMKFKATDGSFFYPNGPCELDAIVFGHLFSILTTELPNMALAATVRKFKTLTDFCRTIEEQVFKSA